MSQKNTQDHGYRTLTPYLIVKDSAAAIEFYKKAFNAIEVMRMALPDGKVMHAEMKIGDSMFMLADEHPEMGALSPTSLGGSGISMHLYVPDVDTFCKNAIDAGLKVLRPVQNQFYGDRMGFFQDPFGHTWSIATRIEDISDKEIEKRFKEMLSQGKSNCH